MDSFKVPNEILCDSSNAPMENFCLSISRYINGATSFDCYFYKTF